MHEDDRRRALLDRGGKDLPRVDEASVQGPHRYANVLQDPVFHVEQNRKKYLDRRIGQKVSVSVEDVGTGPDR
jgi:hypothetical protein